MRALEARPSATARSLSPCAHVALADPRHQEDLVVHREAEDDGEDQRHVDRVERALAFEAEQAVEPAPLEDRDEDAEGGADREQVHQHRLQRQEQRAQHHHQDEEAEREDEEDDLPHRAADLVAGVVAAGGFAADVDGRDLARGRWRGRRCRAAARPGRWPRRTRWARSASPGTGRCRRRRRAARPTLTPGVARPFAREAGDRGAVGAAPPSKVATIWTGSVPPPSCFGGEFVADPHVAVLGELVERLGAGLDREQRDRQDEQHRGDADHRGPGAGHDARASSAPRKPAPLRLRGRSARCAAEDAAPEEEHDLGDDAAGHDPVAEHRDQRPAAGCVAVRIETATTVIAPSAIERSAWLSTIQRPARETITARPEKVTARPEVESACARASSGSRPARALLAVAGEDEERVVDRHPDPDHRGHVGDEDRGLHLQRDEVDQGAGDDHADEAERQRQRRGGERAEDDEQDQGDDREAARPRPSPGLPWRAPACRPRSSAARPGRG